MTYEKVELKIDGMECASCEVLLERKFKKIEGVNDVNVDHIKGKATLICTKVPSINELKNAINDPKYTIFFEKEQNIKSKDDTKIRIKKDHIEIGVIFLIIFALYLIFKQLNILPNLGISDNMSYGFVFFIGLVAAFSTCMAVSGGLLLAVSAKYNELHPNLNNKQKFRPHIYFNIGRIISYTLLGGLLGALGSIFKLSTNITGIIVIIASFVMIILGFQLLKLFPWFDKFKIKMPKFIAHKIHDASTSNSKFASFFLGVFTFFLPCGFTQALQFYVLSKGSFLVGALTMFSFSLGTLPALISVGAISSFSTSNLKNYFTKFVAVLVIFFGFITISSGLTLITLSNNINFGSLIPSVDSGEIDLSGNLIDGKQVVDMKVDGLDYYPSKFNILKGMPVEWRIDGRNAQGCAQIITIPKLGITEQLSRNKINTIKFTPQQTGSIKFSCSMGMAGPGFFNVI